MVYAWGHPPATVTSVKEMVGERSQLSDEVGFPVLAGNVLAVQRMVILAGQVMVGARLSWMKIDWLQLVKFPQASVPFHVRVMV